METPHEMCKRTGIGAGLCVPYGVAVDLRLVRWTLGGMDCEWRVGACGM